MRIIFLVQTLYLNSIQLKNPWGTQLPSKYLIKVDQYFGLFIALHIVATSFWELSSAFFNSQVSAVLQSLLCWVGSDTGFCSSWFKANFVLSHGPLAIAILAWQNSIVFHSLDKMTSFYIHIMPVCFT